MNNMVWSTQELEYFVTHYMPELAADEVYFLSLSARNKYLSTAEREQYQLGRTEMFARTVAYSKQDLLGRALVEMFADLEWRRTKSGLKFPHHALVIYLNVNPSSTVKAWTVLQAEMGQVQNEFLMGVLNGKQPSPDPFKRVGRKWLNAVQRSPGNRFWLDVDFDTQNADMVVGFTNEAHSAGVAYVVVQTQGGYHVLLNRAQLNQSKWQPHRYVQQVNLVAKESGGEVKFNENAMLPLPGTYQAGKPVQVLYTS